MTPNNQTPLFNRTETDLQELNKFLIENKSNSKNNNNLIMYSFFINNKVAIFEAGEPQREFFQSYQSGPLSFEYYLEGSKNNYQLYLVQIYLPVASSRLMSAQSTLT